MIYINMGINMYLCMCDMYLMKKYKCQKMEN